MWRGSLKLPVELMALSNEQWRWIMRRDNEHCEVIIQDKLVEYQRIHTWNGPGCAHVSRCSKVHIENATHSLQDDHPAKMFKIHHWLCPGIALIAHSSQPHRSKAWTTNQHDMKLFLLRHLIFHRQEMKLNEDGEVCWKCWPSVLCCVWAPRISISIKILGYEDIEENSGCSYRREQSRPAKTTLKPRRTGERHERRNCFRGWIPPKCFWKKFTYLKISVFGWHCN